jgi:hypothetical protein
MFRKAGVGYFQIMLRNSIGGTEKYQENSVRAAGVRSVFENSASRMRFILEAVMISDLATVWPNHKQQTAKYKKTEAIFEIFRMQERHIRPKELDN